VVVNHGGGASGSWFVLWVCTKGNITSDTAWTLTSCSCSHCWHSHLKIWGKGSLTATMSGTDREHREQSIVRVCKCLARQGQSINTSQKILFCFCFLFFFLSSSTKKPLRFHFVRKEIEEKKLKFLKSWFWLLRIFCYIHRLVPSLIVIREASSNSGWGQRAIGKHWRGCVGEGKLRRRGRETVVGARGGGYHKNKTHRIN